MQWRPFLCDTQYNSPSPSDGWLHNFLPKNKNKKIYIFHPQPCSTSKQLATHEMARLRIWIQFAVHSAGTLPAASTTSEHGRPLASPLTFGCFYFRCDFVGLNLKMYFQAICPLFPKWILFLYIIYLAHLQWLWQHGYIYIGYICIYGLANWARPFAVALQSCIFHGFYICDKCTICMFYAD